MHYPDLTVYEYSKGYGFKIARFFKMLNIGWLDEKHLYEKGKVSKLFLICLFILCLYPSNPSMGFHSCPFCPPTDNLMEITKEKIGCLEVLFGSAQISVFSLTGKVYIAPNLIYHYTKYHQYKPPNEFVITVFYTSFFYIPLILLWYITFQLPIYLLVGYPKFPNKRGKIRGRKNY